MPPKGWKKYSDKECTIERCHSKPYARRLCASHYNRLVVKGLPLYNRPPKAKCKHPGCDVISLSNGYCSFHYYRSIRGIDLYAPKYPKNHEHIDRDKAIALMYANGYTMQSIGDILGISRQRVERIINK